MNALSLLAAMLAIQTASSGEAVFAARCSVGYCHGVAGAAGRGPRLRGRSLDRGYVERVTRDGIPNSAMPGWQGRLSEDDIDAVVAYVVSLASAPEAVSDNAMPPGEGPAAFAEFAGPPEARRGHDLFFDATRTPRCATCHAASGRGLAVGPDLTAWGTRSAEELVAAVRSRRPRRVLEARLSDGESFPAIRAGRTERLVRLHDLTATPPVLRTLEPSELRALSEGARWSHDAVALSYTDEELRWLLPFLRWTAAARR
jgi:mono/diheme cytochrome c family protein